jgi:2-dehydro-3-deoxygluconokinase
MRVVTFGEALGVLGTLETGPFEYADTVKVGTGGAEANVAIGLARLGVDVTWCGVVGNDPIGRRIIRQLRGEGVHLRHRVDPSRFTGIVLKERPQAGRTSVTYYRAGSAGSTLAPVDIDDQTLAGASVLHVSGITAALSDTARSTVRDVMRRARENGMTISFDINHRNRLWDRSVAAPIYRELVSQADVVFGGLDEARIVLEDDSVTDAAALAALHTLGPEQVIIKLGASGAMAFASGRTVSAAAVSVDVVDTVGAGDAFVAGYLVEYMREPGDTSAALRMACITGAAVCRSGSDWESAARPEEVTAREAAADPDQR